MTQIFRNIFVTVGTTQFDQLIQKLLSSEAIFTFYAIGCQQLTIQYGKFRDLNTLNLFKSIPKISVKLFDYAPSLEQYIKQADLVISHAGAGTSLEVLRLGKPLLVVINECLMDNHQLELATELADNHFCSKTTVDRLNHTLRTLDTRIFRPFPRHNPQLFKKFIQDLFDKSINKTNGWCLLLNNFF